MYHYHSVSFLGVFMDEWEIVSYFSVHSSCSFKGSKDCVSEGDTPCENWGLLGGKNFEKLEMRLRGFLSDIV